MSKVGIATLPLHGYKAPQWLLKRMVGLGRPLLDIIHDMEGPEGILRRLSDTYWFQGLACIMGYDWHSSGCTTVLGGVLKQIIDPEIHGLIIGGGKGKSSKRVKEHLLSKAKILDYTEDDIDKFCEISRLVAKVDNAAIQDGFSLYHHMILISDKNWTIINQGLDSSIKKARRYHWLSVSCKDFLANPHNDITTEVLKESVLDMAAKSSSNCRNISLKLIKEGSERIKRYLNKLKDRNQRSLDDFLTPAKSITLKKLPHLNMPIPFTLKWESVDLAKDLALNDYTDLLKVKGFGPGMIRALALISEFIWGEAPSWKDPAKYSYAFGGKDGIPYPTNVRRMERCTEMLKDAINSARVGNLDKINALKRLQKFRRKNTTS